MSAQSQVNTSVSVVADSPHCTFRTSDNRKCTMLRHASHPSLCLFHARKERLLLESTRIGPELASLSGEFRTHADVNHALTKLWELLAHDRISRKRAATFAYIAALLYPTIERVRVESNMASRNLGFDAWKEALARSFPPRKPIQSPSLEK